MTIGLLRDVVVPRIEAVRQHLVTARHTTTLDDRLAERPPCVRLRIDPWRGPFDAPEERADAVLEVVVEGRWGEEVSGRIWLDTLSLEPTNRHDIDVRELNPAWVDRLLLEFVDRALSRG